MTRLEGMCWVVEVLVAVKLILSLQEDSELRKTEETDPKEPRLCWPFQLLPDPYFSRSLIFEKFDKQMSGAGHPRAQAWAVRLCKCLQIHSTHKCGGIF